MDALSELGRSTPWHLKRTMTVRGDVGHPQGITRWGDRWLVTTVHPGRCSGEVLIVSADGDVEARQNVTDGDRFHPGGVSADHAGCWVAVAEYRPRSTTTVLRLDTDLDAIDSFPFDDHLGAVCPLGDGTLFAVSWASRRWYRLDRTGRLLDQRTTPTRWVDIQDLQHLQDPRLLPDQQVIATGVGELATPAGPLQLGGLAVIDVNEMVVVHDAPIAAWMPSGRAATYNAAHLDIDIDGAVSLNCLVDDTVGAIGTWTASERSDR